MQESKLTLKIDCDKIPAKEFRESINNFIDLIDNVARNICSGEKCINQLISIEHGSAILHSYIEQKDEKYFEYPLKVVQAVSEGFKCLEKDGGKPPKYFNNKSLELVKNIAKHKDVKIITPKNEEIPLTNNTVNNIALLTQLKTSALGSIEGKIQTISTRKGLKVTIYEALNDNPVKCACDDEKISEILKSSIDKRVCARGEIFYNKDGIPQKIKINELRILGQEPLPNWEDVRGILND
ncbi:MAG: hypothetical protein A2Y25_00355 [Candidatus Melainabacteria bacterium GWF2_37_15]|nr:MAG: hypothetical protein A2Y25_00355 [Candidatus Melainabacteria bacterium GWF2_37_15]